MEVEKRTYKVSSLQELLYPLAKGNTGDYNEELTEEEKQAAIDDAARRKRDLVRYNRNQEKIKRWEQELQRKWSPNELVMFIQYKAEERGKPLVIDAANHTTIKALCHYFTESEKFNTMGEGYSLEKGLMLCGGVGLGKTFLMDAFRANQRRCFQVVPCRDIADVFAKEGHEILHYYSKPTYVPTHLSTFYQRDIGICFDDLGTEGSKKHYGDQVNVMADILLNRYDKGTVPFHYTHLTTNLTAEEIEGFYGTRVRSRMREMFNMITLSGEDRRK